MALHTAHPSSQHNYDSMQKRALEIYKSEQAPGQKLGYQQAIRNTKKALAGNKEKGGYKKTSQTQHACRAIPHSNARYTTPTNQQHRRTPKDFLNADDLGNVVWLIFLLVITVLFLFSVLIGPRGVLVRKFGRWW